MKDFKLRGTEHLVKKRSNKKLTEQQLKKVEDSGEVDEKSYLTITQPKKKKNHVKEYETKLSKAKNENHLGVPQSFYKLSAPEQAFLMYYLSSDFVHPITMKHTHMNLLQSYITVFCDEDDIFSIWEKEYVEDDNGNKHPVIGKVKNYNKRAEIEQRAMEMFHQNPDISRTWADMIEMSFGAEPEKLVKNAILKDALFAEKSSERNANRNLAVKVLNLDKQADDSGTVNVFIEGGGKELLNAISKNANDDGIVTEEDLEVIEDVEEE